MEREFVTLRDGRTVWGSNVQDVSKLDHKLVEAMLRVTPQIDAAKKALDDAVRE